MLVMLRFLAVATFLSSFSSIASDQDFELECGADFEEIVSENMINQDKKLVDAALEPVLQLLDLGRGGIGRRRKSSACSWSSERWHRRGWNRKESSSDPAEYHRLRERI